MIFSIVILAISLSLDALGVGLAYGMRKVKVPLVSKLIICFLSMAYSGTAIIAGKSLTTVLTPFAGKMIGVSILIFMGAGIILKNILTNEKDEVEKEKDTEKNKLFNFVVKSLGITIQVIRNPIVGDVDKSGTIDIKESFLLGLALSVDAIGVGIGSALTGFHSMTIPIAVGIFQLGFLCSGLYFGEKFTLIEKVNKNIIAYLPGILLICLALIRI